MVDSDGANQNSVLWVLETPGVNMAEILHIVNLVLHLVALLWGLC
jgi:hypothetical protein